MRSDGWQPTRLDLAFFCLRENSCVRGGGEKVDTCIQRLLSEYEDKEVKQAAEKDGVLFSGKRINVESDTLGDRRLAIIVDQSHTI